MEKIGWLALAGFGVPGVVFAQASTAPVAAGIQATVTGLRSARGFVDVALYSNPSRWPEEDGSITSCRARIQNGQATCTLTGRLAQGGWYAIAFTHDENANGRFDTNFIGLPQEGYGFSNDAHPVLSAPSFNACRFRYAGGLQPVRMRVQY